MGERDFDFLTGDWHVHHRKLTRRLADSNDWIEFDGTCTCWPLLGGRANVDDNVLRDPAGEYRAASLRRYDPRARRWSIWWLDERSGSLEPPVHGGFDAGTGVGTFIGDDTFEQRPIVVRFTWSGIDADAALWTQAFSADAGASWEENWRMRFERVRRHSG